MLGIRVSAAQPRAGAGASEAFVAFAAFAAFSAFLAVSSGSVNVA